MPQRNSHRTSGPSTRHAAGLVILLMNLWATDALIRLDAQTRPADWRRFSEGNQIASEGYADQPYVVITKDGTWVCVMTTGRGEEGAGGQHIVSSRSTDKGKTWTPLTNIEPADGPAASWAMPLITPSGRIYVFYTYNRDNDKTNGAVHKPNDTRVDTQGYFAYKYSDDAGVSWSQERYYIPLRKLEIDFKNPLGQRDLFWGIGEPVTDRGHVFIGAAKVAYFGYSFLPEDRGIIFHSPNILSESDPAKHEWEMLPKGDKGLESVLGPVSEEHNLVPLSDGTLYAMARTVEGYPVHYYSRDRGATWTKPEYATYTPGGQKMRNPRACPRLWKTSNGKYLFWYHNNGEMYYPTHQGLSNRNIAWISGGVERNGKMHWTQPEAVRYVDDVTSGTSYPDLVEDNGRFFITATEKTQARVGEVPASFLNTLWGQFDRNTVTQQGLILTKTSQELKAGSETEMPQLPNLSKGGGFTLEFWLKMNYPDPDQVLLDSTTSDGAGIRVTTKWLQQLQIRISDGKSEFNWETDRGMLTADKPHHVAFIIDGGPKLLSVVIDGRLCDGGSSDARQYGYGRFNLMMLRQPAGSASKDLEDVGGRQLQILPHIFANTELQLLRIYDRALMTTEAVGNWRAGMNSSR